MSDDPLQSFPGRRAGQFLFAAAFLALSVLLLSQIGGQTVWKKGANLAAQARFWPAIGLGGMVLFTALHLWHMPRRMRRVTRPDWAETRRWAGVLEYAGWFAAYVFTVPVLGYLPMTLAFALALTWRLGYRSRRWLAVAAVFAVAVVVIFKGLLSVRIPGAMVYEYLPGALRSFAILYL